MPFKSNQNFSILFLFGVLVALSVLFYRDTIRLFPTYIHAWTQSDRYALALGFLENGLNPFLPQTFNLETTDGITSTDLPLIEYLSALVMKITGSTAPAIFRCCTLLFAFAGSFFLFRFTSLVTRSASNAIILALFFFTLPVLVYYNDGFIPSVPAFAFTMAGFSFYGKYLRDARVQDFWWCTILLAFAALIRMTFNIFLFAFLLSQITGHLQKGPSFRGKLLPFTAAYGLVALYTLYKEILKARYGTMFLTELMPARSWEEFTALLQQIWENWHFDYFTPAHYGLIALAFIHFLIAKKREPEKKIPWHFPFFGFAGAGIFFLLMIRQYPAHDYYFIDTFYPAVALFLVYLLQFKPAKWLQVSFSAAAALLTGLSVYYAKANHDQRNTFRFWDRGEQTRQNFTGADKWLDSLGVSRDSKILVPGSYSTNIPLILMHRYGYTAQQTGREYLEKALENDFDYIVLQDEFFPSDVIYNLPELKDHLERIAGNGKISLFEYRKNRQRQSVEQLLGIPADFPEFKETFDKDSLTSYWNFGGKKDPAKSFSESFSALIESTDEFGPSAEFPVLKNRGMIFFKGQFLTGEPEKYLTIAAVIRANDKTLEYQGIDLMIRKANQWTKFSCVFEIPADLPEGATFKCFIYNTHHIKVWVDDLVMRPYSLQ